MVWIQWYLLLHRWLMWGRYYHLMLIYFLFYVQKLSLLVTEAYKDAHQKSVQVRISYTESRTLFHLSHRIEVLAILIFSGHEGEDEWSCSELGNASGCWRGIKVILVSYHTGIWDELQFWYTNRTGILVLGHSH